MSIVKVIMLEVHSTFRDTQQYPQEIRIHPEDLRLLREEVAANKYHQPLGYYKPEFMGYPLITDTTAIRRKST